MTTLSPEQYPAYALACINRHAPEHAETLAQAMGLAPYVGHDRTDNTRTGRKGQVVRVPDVATPTQLDPSTVGRAVRTTGRVLARRVG